MTSAPVCAACGGTTRRDGATPDGPLLRCRRCRSRRILIGARPADPCAYGEAYRGGADQAKVDRLVELFRSAVGAAPGRVLDVGCGDGTFLAAVRAAGWTGLGLDLDPSAIDAARARHLDAVVGAAGSADLGGRFDAATLWDLLEHVGDPGATAAWLAGQVAAGGHIVVVTPDAGSIFDRAAAWERRASLGRSARLDQLCLNRYHLHRFSAAGLTRLFDDAGFTAVSLRRIQLFSLRPERYLAGFAPGIRGFTGLRRVDGWLSRSAYAAVTHLRLTNKLLYVGRRREDA